MVDDPLAEFKFNSKIIENFEFLKNLEVIESRIKNDVFK